MNDEPGARLLLRAELEHPRGTFVTHTLHVRKHTVTVACGDVPVDTRARLKLSFPKLIAPFEVEGRAIETQNSDGLGSPASTTFEITNASPAARNTLAEIALLNCEPPTRPGKRTPVYRCLLVEDNPFIFDLFVWGMDKYRHDRRTELSLAHATDVEHAWELLQSRGYDLVIVDHYLPTANGAILIERIRREPSFSGIPVVAMSVGGNEVREASMAAGADLFLDKPIVLRDLYATLDRLTPLQGRSA